MAGPTMGKRGFCLQESVLAVVPFRGEGPGCLFTNSCGTVFPGGLILKHWLLKSSQSESQVLEEGLVRAHGS